MPVRVLSWERGPHPYCVSQRVSGHNAHFHFSKTARIDITYNTLIFSMSTKPSMGFSLKFDDFI